MATQLKTDYRFDPQTCRHYLNDFCTVLHCHHFVTLYTQLADDAVHFEGERLLKETAEDTFYEVLKVYFFKHDVTALADQIGIAEQYWQTVGMGKLQFREVGKYTVRADMPSSHVDQGWLVKWGAKDRPVNFITEGFVAAVASLVNDRPTKSYAVRELKSLVSGDEKSVFKATLK
jgi:hypothetical protein